MTCSRCPNEAGRFVNCKACRQKNAEANKRWYDRNPGAKSRSNKKSRAKMLDEGRCQRCGDGPLASSTCCQACLDYQSLSDAARRGPSKRKRACTACGSLEHLKNNHRCPARFSVQLTEYALARNAA